MAGFPRASEYLPRVRYVVGMSTCPPYRASFTASWALVQPFSRAMQFPAFTASYVSFVIAMPKEFERVPRLGGACGPFHPWWGSGGRAVWRAVGKRDRCARSLALSSTFFDISTSVTRKKTEQDTRPRSGDRRIHPGRWHNTDLHHKCKLRTWSPTRLGPQMTLSPLTVAGSFRSLCRAMLPQ